MEKEKKGARTRMNKWHKYLVVTLLAMLVAALWTGPVGAAAPKVNISVQTNFGSFKLSIAADTPENKLADVVSEQVWGQMGAADQQYGPSLAGPFRYLARQLVPPSKLFYGTLILHTADPKPDQPIENPTPNHRRV